MTRVTIDSAHISSQTEDGRTARGRRTREAVVEALIALLNQGDVRPTAARVAERAGVSLRSVFQHFTDLEDLFATVAERQFALVQGLPPAPDPGEPLDRRLAAFVARRTELLERITPVRRAANLQEPFSPVVRNRLEQMRVGGRAEIARIFASELDRLPEDSRVETIAVLAAVASWSNWECLRAEQGLSRPVAERVVACLLRAALAGASVPEKASLFAQTGG